MELMTQLVPRTEEALSNLSLRVTFSAGAATFLTPADGIDEMVQGRRSAHVRSEAFQEGKLSTRGGGAR